MTTMSLATDRTTRAADVIQGIPEDQVDRWNADHLDLSLPYLLIERNRHPTGNHWLSTHAMVELAAHHCMTQDDAEDWEPMRLVDLDSGQTFYPTMMLRWDASILESA